MTNLFEPDDALLASIVDLAKETEVTDPIDWGNLNISEDQAYKMMASHVMEMDLDDLTSRAIITKMLVENFVLNVKLLTSQQ